MSRLIAIIATMAMALTCHAQEEAVIVSVTLQAKEAVTISDTIHTD